MKNKIYLLSFLLVFLVLQNGYAQDDRWRYMFSEGDYSVYLDTRTVTRSNPGYAGRRFEIWTKWYCLNDCYSSSEGATKEFTMHKMEIDCKDRLLRVMEYTEYFLDRSTKTFKASKGWQSVVPETFGELILEHVCNNY